MDSLRLLLVLLALAASAQSLAGQSPSVSPDDLRLVVEIPAADDEIFFARVAGITVAAGGRIFVLDADRKEPSIRAFRADGAFIGNVGRVGSGPGEYRQPGSILLRGNELVVPDAQQRRWVRFTLEGTPVRTERFGADESRYGVTPYALRGGATLVLATAIFSSDPAVGYDPHHRLLFRSVGAASFDTIGVFRSEFIGYRSSSRFGMTSSGVGNGGAWALSGDSLLAVANGYDGSVRWYAIQDGHAHGVRSATVAGESRPVTSRDRSRLHDRLRRELPGSEGLTFDDPPPIWSRITRALFADDGALWLGRPSDESGTLWSVFPSDRRAEPYTVVVPPGFTLYAVHSGRLYGSATADDEPVVRVYLLPRR
jgi:hypothetical protein